MTPEQRSMRSRLGAHTRWANTPDRSAATEPARKAWKNRWLKLADPDGTMPPEQAHAKAEQLEKAHFVRMALASSQSRARKRRAS